MSQVNIRTDEPIEKALKRLKRQLDIDVLMREFIRRRYDHKPSAVKRHKMKEAKFKAYLVARDARD